MTDRPDHASRRRRGSVKEAIGKIAGDDVAIAEGGAEKTVGKNKLKPD